MFKGHKEEHQTKVIWDYEKMKEGKQPFSPEIFPI